jgi:hypothetical protein
LSQKLGKFAQKVSSRGVNRGPIYCILVKKYLGLSIDCIIIKERKGKVGTGIAETLHKSKFFIGGSRDV